MKNCKHCGSEKLTKIGFKHVVQKWKCENCGKNQRAVDRREKYTEKERKAAEFVVGGWSKDVCKELLNKLKECTIGTICNDVNYAYDECYH